MAPHSSTLAWKIPWTEEPGGLQSMGSGRIWRDWATSLSLFTFMHWTRKWQPTPVFLPGESQGRGSLVGCRLWGCTESDTSEATAAAGAAAKGWFLQPNPTQTRRWFQVMYYSGNDEARGWSSSHFQDLLKLISYFCIKPGSSALS